MIDIEILRKQPQIVIASLKKRGGDVVRVDELIKLDNAWRSKTEEVEALRSKQKTLSNERRIDEAKINKEAIKQAESELLELQSMRDAAWIAIPNILHEDVPEGKDDSENKVIKTWGVQPAFTFPPKDHMALGESLDIIDMERAAEVTGARFYYLKGDGALLEFALLHYAMSRLTDEAWIAKVAAAAGDGVSTKTFIPVIPPVMVRPDVFVKMARLQPGVDEDERYYIPSDDQYLIGSAEHTLGPLHMNSTLNEDDLPIRYVGFSTCFRREAGSYGKDTKGMIRVHQFDKVEMETFATADMATQEQNFLVTVQETLLQELGLPYQVVAVCGGDIGSPDARQIDLECWMPGQQKYRETNSADLVSDYQARRLNTKVRRKEGVEFVHMNDATAIAMSRIIVALLENYQQEDGTIAVPQVLRPFIGKDRIS